MPLNPLVSQKTGITEEQLVKLIHDDVQGIFTTMVGIEDLLHLPIQVDAQTHFNDCITAMVGFAGTYDGILNLHVPQTLALSFTSSMLGMEVTELGEDVSDALGEIANMIAGSFKQHLSRGGNDIHLSTPSIVTGKEYVLSSGSAGDTLTLLFDTCEQWFMVSIVIVAE